MAQIDWSFLYALNVGERYEVDITPSYAENVNKLAPTRRLTYLRAMNASWRMSNATTKFIIRRGDFRIKAEINKAYIYCIEKDGQKMERIPSAGGFKAVINADKRKKEKVKALSEEMVKARAAQSAQIKAKAGAKPPHIREVTVDDQLRLVELVRAFERGETIETMHTSGVWGTAPGVPNWALPVHRLRIKPKPLRELWVLYSRGKVGDIEHALDYFDYKPDSDPECLVHFREVIEEDDG